MAVAHSSSPGMGTAAQENLTAYRQLGSSGCAAPIRKCRLPDLHGPGRTAGRPLIAVRIVRRDQLTIDFGHGKAWARFDEAQSR
jgi:hypothetical protein